METNLFELSDYKKFLRKLVADPASGGRGTQRRLAERLRVQGPFITQVLTGPLHFSLEQALGVASYFGLAPAEREYFLALVSWQRAGTPELREYFGHKLGVLRDANRQIKTRMKMEDSLDREARATYYASWHCCAIHMALTIPAMQTRAALLEAFAIPAKKLDEVLEFLVQTGLVERRGQSLGTTGKWIHLESDSPLLPRHHTNLRLAGIASLDSGRVEDLHYSAYFSCSQKDLGRLREMMLKTLGEFNALVRPSKEEVLAGIGLDLFQVTGS